MPIRKRLGAILVAGFIISCIAGAAKAFQLPDSGQTTCYDERGTVIPCAGTGQDGAYSINPLRYTDNGNGTVTDKNTGLVWQQQDDGNRYNWYQASGTYDVKYNPSTSDVCGALVLGGASDWRLPTKIELASIVDYSIAYPLGYTIQPVFTNTKPWYYWSSTLMVSFSHGEVAGYPKEERLFVRCVRGGKWSGPVLAHNGNGTVTDSRTGLVWEQAGPGPKTWNNALAYCEGLTLAGNADWRLPNARELGSLTDEVRALDRTFFPKTFVFPWWWSSTTYASDHDLAWRVHFGAGVVSGNGKDDELYVNVRCVRGGLSGPASKAVYLSQGAYDGRIRESSETSSRGGTLDAGGTTVRVGDDASNRQHRAFLSFSTAAMPDSAVILSAKLKLRFQGLVGKNPFTTHGNLLVDAKLGVFSNNPALQSGDFQAVPTRVAAATMLNRPVSGWYSTSIAPAYVNQRGHSQFRLRFNRGDDNDWRADYLSFYSGNAAVVYRPALEVLYYVP